MREEDEKRLVGLLGLAARSGNILTGQKAVKRYISSNVKEKVVIFASDYGHSVEAIVRKCEMHKVPYVKLKIGKVELGRCLGKKEISVIGVDEEGFVKGIKGIINV